MKQKVSKNGTKKKAKKKKKKEKQTMLGEKMEAIGTSSSPYLAYVTLFLIVFKCPSFPLFFFSVNWLH